MNISALITLICLSGGVDLPENYEIQASYADLKEVCGCEHVHVSTSKKVKGKRIHILECEDE